MQRQRHLQGRRLLKGPLGHAYGQQRILQVLHFWIFGPKKSTRLILRRAAFEFGPGAGSQGVARPEIRLYSITSDTLKVILDYLYLMQIDLDRANVWDILLAADFLQVPELSRKCISFMEENLSLPQCIKIFEMTQE